MYYYEDNRAMASKLRILLVINHYLASKWLIRVLSCHPKVKYYFSLSNFWGFSMFSTLRNNQSWLTVSLNYLLFLFRFILFGAVFQSFRSRMLSVFLSVSLCFFLLFLHRIQDKSQSSFIYPESVLPVLCARSPCLAQSNIPLRLWRPRCGEPSYSVTDLVPKSVTTWDTRYNSYHNTWDSWIVPAILCSVPDVKPDRFKFQHFFSEKPKQL